MRMALALVALAFIPTAALASEPLVTKSSYPGFVHPDWIRTEQCELFLDKVVITRTFGLAYEDGVVVTEERPLAVSESILRVIANAATETAQQRPNYLCDGPSTRTVAKAPGSEEEIILFSTGGCGAPRVERNGAAARVLRDLIDGYCPKTHDFGAEEDDESDQAL